MTVYHMKRFIKTDQDKAQLIAFIQNQSKPITVTIEQGIIGKRSLDQNKLQRLWINELAEQGDMTAEEYRAFCKLHFGVPILRSENERFCQLYDKKVKWRSYADKLEFMAEPFDFPVTRLMTTKQHKQYLDAIYVHYTGLGFRLTDPENLWSDDEKFN
ncbi:hypothetical protein [Moraxella sp. VT-16-12]|uniref:hypothetical protein n=1 Tax=Moraxella sp. VT-16-12 TaxID=2014877 RepID=UPI000B7EFD81|nr:hypothetical protein [Moraxella sp. VT-16-12]TWV81527.1 hypothetical protein CEW93_007370 [Moraxella sp. VT-16-12]